MRCREEAQPKREFQAHQSTVQFYLWEGWQGITFPRAANWMRWDESLTWGCTLPAHVVKWPHDRTFNSQANNLGWACPCMTDFRTTPCLEQDKWLFLPWGAHQGRDCLQHWSQGVMYNQCWNMALPHLLGKNISKQQLQLEMNNIFKLAANWFHPYKTITYPKAPGGLYTHTHTYKNWLRYLGELIGSQVPRTVNFLYCINCTLRWRLN